MILNYEDIKNITQGAERVVQTEKGVRFYRFSKTEEDIYLTLKNECSPKVFATSGICLEFETDSSYLYIDVDIEGTSTRSFYSVDILVDNVLVDNVCNYQEGDVLLEKEYEIKGQSKCIDLPEGTKIVKIVFPQLMTTILKELSISDNSIIKAINKKPLLYMYGDSITQGYDAVHPVNTYAYRLAEKMDAELVNKAIGGDVHFPELSKCTPIANPDYITVSYGTNDWSHGSFDEFKNNCEEFYKNLTDNYPNSKIFAITPIWRKDYCDYRIFGDFKQVGEFIKATANKYNNVTAIDGFDFVPKEERYFLDLNLHPTDEGFAYYADNLYKAICEHL